MMAGERVSGECVVGGVCAVYVALSGVVLFVDVDAQMMCVSYG